MKIVELHVHFVNYKMANLKLPQNVKLYKPFEEYPARCKLELQMLQLSQEIRNKPEWRNKLDQVEIVNKWKSEAAAQGLNEDAINFVIDQLKYFKTICDESIEPGPIEGVWISNSLIDESLEKELKDLVSPLENVPEKDFHPGSDDLVVDLVHPSLYCYVENFSLLLKQESIDKEFLPLPVDEPERKKVRGDWMEMEAPSRLYRWLPSDVICDEKGALKLESYINNLHPIEHSKLYRNLEKILEKFLPMFNRCLTDLTNWKGPIIDMTEHEFYTPFAQASAEYDEDAHGRWEETRQLLPVKIPKFQVPQHESAFKIDLKNQKLQIIVKLANIELTPEKPKYDGGMWHVEGIDEERIVASGIYYYEMDNISESKLTFRQMIADPPYEQDDEKGVLEIFGLKDAEELNQIVGDVIAKKGRCVVFPNIYQHKVEAFELIDKTKNGSRKILVFFLVDPTVSIVSTKNVAPQQESWKETDGFGDMERRTMSKQQAQEFREKLMFERKYSKDKFQSEFYERSFSLCEH